MRFFSLLILLFISTGLRAQQSATYWFDKGTETQDPLLQVDYFTRAIEGGLTQNVVYYYRAYAQSQLDRHELALNDYRAAEAATGNVKKTYIWSGMAWSYYALGKTTEGLAAAQKATTADANNSDAWNITGWLQMEKQNYAASADAFTKYLALEEDKYYGYRSRSYALLLGKEYARALADCEAGLALKPGDDYLLERKALVLMKLNRQDEAMAIIHDRIEYKQDDPISLSNLGSLFYQNGDYRTAIEYHNEGIKLYQKKIAIDPTFIKVYKDDVYRIYLNRGEAYYMLKDYQTALADFTKATTIKPEDYEAWYEIGELQTYQENYLEATIGYEKAFAIKPDLKDGWVNLGFCYDHINEREKAINAYTRGIKADPTVGLLWNNRGYAYLEMKQYDKALADLTKAIEVDPSVVMSHVSLGEYYYFRGDYATAITKLTEAIEMEGGDVAEYSAAYYTRGACHIQLKNAAQGEEDEKAALRLDASHIKAWEQLGIAHYDQKEMCEAFKAFKKAMELDQGHTVRETKESPAYLAKLTTNPCNE